MIQTCHVTSHMTVSRNRCRQLFLVFAAVCVTCVASGSGGIALADVEGQSPEEIRASSILQQLHDVSEDERPQECERLLQEPEPVPGFHRFLKTYRVSLLNAQDHQTAIRELRRYIQESQTPEDIHEFRRWLVGTLEESGHRDEAIAEQRTLVRESSPSEQRRELATLADLLQKDQQFDEALKAWEQTHNLDRSSGRRMARDTAFGMTECLLALDRPQEALSRIDPYVPDDADETNLYWHEWALVHRLKASIHDRLGQSEDAAIERHLEKGALEKGGSVLPIFSRRRTFDWNRNIEMPPIWVWATPIPILWLIYLAASWKQRRLERGAWFHGLVIPGIMACLTLLPIVAFLVMNAHEPFPDNQQFFNAFIGSLISFIYTFVFFKPLLTTTADQKTRPFPEVEDPAVLQAVESLSSRMGIRTPSVRQFPLLMYSGSIYAQVSGLVASTVTVNSDVLHRLTAEERDAILAHELAHLRNHTLGIFASITPITWAIGVLCLPQHDIWTFVTWSILCSIGFKKLVSRRLEYDCDRRAAELCGADHMASALVKIHAASPLQDQRLVAQLAYATQTHPSREQRLGALVDQFPEMPRPAEAWSLERRTIQTLTNWLVGLSWALMLAVLAYLPAGWGHNLVFGLCCLALLAPMILLRLAWRPEVSRNLQRIHGHGTSWRIILGVGVAAAIGLLGFAFWDTDSVHKTRDWISEYSKLLPIAVSVAIIGAFIVLSRSSKKTQVTQRIQDALVQRDWPRILSIAEQERKFVEQNFECRHNIALARWLNGDEEQAVHDMTAVFEKFSDRAVSGLVLWDMHMEREEWDRTTEIANQYLERFPDDPVGYSIKVSSLARSHRTEEARQLLESRVWPEEETYNKLAIEGRLAMQDGNWTLARQRMDQADEIFPGALRLRLLRAELEIECGDLESAGQILDQAERQLADSPFELVGKRTARLRTRWNELRTR